MERFTSERLCPVCKAKMTFEHETLDGWITLYECYTCPVCKYNDGRETGSCWVEANGRRFEWAYDKTPPSGIKEAIKRHCLALAQSPEFQAPVVERMEY